MANIRLIAFMVMVILFFSSSYYLLDLSVLAWFSKVFAIAVAFLKGVWSRFSWEALPGLFAKWIVRTLFKLLFVQIPLTLIRLLVMVALMHPKRKHQWLRYAAIGKKYFLDLYKALMTRFTKYFGRHAYIAFFFSIMVTIIIFAVTLFYGFGVVYSSLFAGVWTWALGWIVWALEGLVYRFPWLGRFFALVRNQWETKVKARYPRIVLAHRLFMIRIVRVAIKARLIRTGAQVRVAQQIVKKKNDLALLAQARLMSSQGKGMPWEDLDWHGHDLGAMVEQHSSCVADRAYMRMLGADLQLSLAEGARACGRPAQHGINRHPRP